MVDMAAENKWRTVPPLGLGRGKGDTGDKKSGGARFVINNTAA